MAEKDFRIGSGGLDEKALREFAKADRKRLKKAAQPEVPAGNLSPAVQQFAIDAYLANLPPKADRGGVPDAHKRAAQLMEVADTLAVVGSQKLSDENEGRLRSTFEGNNFVSDDPDQQLLLNDKCNRVNWRQRARPLLSLCLGNPSTLRVPTRFMPATITR